MIKCRFQKQSYNPTRAILPSAIQSSYSRSRMLAPRFAPQQPQPGRACKAIFCRLSESAWTEKKATQNSTRRPHQMQAAIFCPDSPGAGRQNSRATGSPATAEGPAPAEHPPSLEPSSRRKSRAGWRPPRAPAQTPRRQSGPAEHPPSFNAYAIYNINARILIRPDRAPARAL